MKEPSGCRHFPLFYCQADSLLSPTTTRCVCIWQGWVFPPPRALVKVVPRPHIAIRDPQECVAAANSNPSHVVLWLFPRHLWQKKISSHKQVLFSFALIYLLTDNIPCFLNTLLRSTQIPLLPAGPHYFILGKSLASGASCLRDKWEEVTQRPFPGQIPGILLYCHL